MSAVVAYPGWRVRELDGLEMRGTPCIALLRPKGTFEPRLIIPSTCCSERTARSAAVWRLCVAAPIQRCHLAELIESARAPCCIAWLS